MKIIDGPYLDDWESSSKHLDKEFGTVLGKQIDLLPEIIKSLYRHDYNNAVKKLTQYITWLQTYEEPKAIRVVENIVISYQFKLILKVVQLEYKNEDLFHSKNINIIKYTRDFTIPPIDIDYLNELSFAQKQQKISEIISKVFYWLLESDNPIRNRMILLNLHHKNWGIKLDLAI